MFQLLFFFSIPLLLIGLPCLAIATENSGKCADRQTYIIVLLIYVVSIIAIRYSMIVRAPMEIIALEALAGIALTIWLLRVMVQRVRDMGKPKSLSYVAVVPIIGFLFQLYLTFPDSISRSGDR
jgi:uncharacterized membrane protein YhaH (DUF805 family)